MTDEAPRCPRCGTRADATSRLETLHPPVALADLRRNLEVVRNELGLATDDEAVEAAVREVARRLNLEG